MKVLLLAISCLVISASAKSTLYPKIEQEPDESVITDASDTDSVSDVTTAHEDNDVTTKASYGDSVSDATTENVNEVVTTAASDKGVISDASIQKGEMFQEIGRQVKAIANHTETSPKKVSKIKRFFRAVKKAFKEACKAFVKTGKEAFIREVNAEFEEEIGKVKKTFGMYSLNEETTYQHMLLNFAEDMELIGSMYIAKGRKQYTANEATRHQ
uniref:Putative conserved secreted protein n=1 Tax=Ixodes scapularis TaxID=6945 RepID=A0A4D5RR79_IXOSC